MKRSSENPKCKLCELHLETTEGSTCLKGEGGDAAKLLIFLDSPNFVEDRCGRIAVGDAGDLLRNLLARMTLKPQDYYIDYVLKCFKGKNKSYGRKASRLDFIESCSKYRFATLQRLRPREVVGMGSLSCEAFVGSHEVSQYAGAAWNPSEPEVRDYISRIWITYSPAFPLNQPSEVVGIYRTIFAAAKAARLNPHFNSKIKPYDYGH